MAIDRANRRLFISCRSRVMAVMHAETGKVSSSLSMGVRWTRRRSIPSRASYSVTVIQQENPDRYSVVQVGKTLARAKTMALDPKTHRLFLSTSEGGQFEVLVLEME
jgi:hypothetical protein